VVAEEAQRGVPAPDPGDSRERILVAAETCFARWGVVRTRMEDIAKQAGVARPTLYRYFPGKEVLQQAVMVRHIRRRAEELHAAVPRRGPSGPLILRALVAGIAEPPADRVSESVLGSDVVHETARLVAGSGPIFEAMFDYWEPYLRHAQAQGELQEGVDLERAVRWLTMIVFYCLTVPEVAPGSGLLEADLRAFVVNAIVTPDAWPPRRGSRSARVAGSSPTPSPKSR
jgi:AcrR family transcriptional regulator